MPENCYISGVIRVLSCNLFAGRADSAALLRLIAEHSVDIVCAQELSTAHASALNAALPYGDLDHDQIVKGNGIASRRPVTCRRVALPKRDAWVATLEPADWPALRETIQIVNVHISAPHLWPYFPHPVRRRRQLGGLLADRARHRHLPHALFGDFNASPAWPVYRRMAQHYKDGAVQAANGAKPGPTWPRVPWLGLRGLIRIDHCFLWQLDIRHCETVEIPGTDHFALLADLALPDEHAQPAHAWH
jgi:endonuclease/exonuclease/phosphatase (EEP) superfamily protein YafD